MRIGLKQNVGAIVLLGAIASIALVAAWSGLSSSLEAVSFVTGASCVWLIVKENVWSFPIGLLNVTTFCIVFFRSRLYADAGLQIVYFVLGVIGWYMWLYGGKNRTTLRVSRASTVEALTVVAFVISSTLGMWQFLHSIGGSASFWDALTTSISLGSQWLLNRKRLESWIGWTLVDIIYVPLYLYKELYLTAVLYGLFLVMAVIGFLTWRRSWLLGHHAEQVDPRPGATLP